MSNSEAEPIAASLPTQAAAGDLPPRPGTYTVSRDGRRQAIILLLGVISIGIFAVWTIVTILQDGVTNVEWVSGLLMLGVLLVSPFVAWTLLEEINARIVTSDRGITYTTLGGINLTCAWGDVAGFKEKGSKGRLARFFLGDDDSDTTINKQDDNARTVKAGEDDEETLQDDAGTALLLLHSDSSAQIANPMVRFLHKQAHGNALPIYGGLQNRDALIAEISSHVTK